MALYKNELDPGQAGGGSGYALPPIGISSGTIELLKNALISATGSWALTQAAKNARKFVPPKFLEDVEEDQALRQQESKDRSKYRQIERKGHKLSEIVAGEFDMGPWMLSKPSPEEKAGKAAGRAARERARKTQEAEWKRQNAGLAPGEEAAIDTEEKKTTEEVLKRLRGLKVPTAEEIKSEKEVEESYNKKTLEEKKHQESLEKVRKATPKQVESWYIDWLRLSRGQKPMFKPEDYGGLDPYPKPSDMPPPGVSRISALTGDINLRPPAYFNIDRPGEKHVGKEPGVYPPTQGKLEQLLSDDQAKELQRMREMVVQDFGETAMPPEPPESPEDKQKREKEEYNRWERAVNEEKEQKLQTRLKRIDDWIDKEYSDLPEKLREDYRQVLKDRIRVRGGVTRTELNKRFNRLFDDIMEYKRTHLSKEQRAALKTKDVQLKELQKLEQLMQDTKQKMFELKSKLFP